MKIRFLFISILLNLLFLHFLSDVSPAKEMILEISALPPSGLALIPVSPVFEDGSNIEAQFGKSSFSALYVSDSSADAKRGWLVCRFPQDLVKKSQKKILKGVFRSDSKSRKNDPDASSRKKMIPINTPAYKTAMRSDHQAGFPARIDFHSGFVFKPVSWGDRIFDPDKSPDNSDFFGSWDLALDKSPRLDLVADNEDCTVVRQNVRFVNRAGKTPPSQPAAEYLWFFFKNADGNVFVHYQAHQETDHPWKECHFFELHADSGILPNWEGIDSRIIPNKKTQGTFSNTLNRVPFDRGLLLREKKEGIIIDGFPGILFGDIPNKRVYIHPFSADAWKGWKEKSIEKDLWFRFGSVGDPSLSGSPNRLRPDYFRWVSSASDWKEKAKEIALWSGQNSPNKIDYLESADLALAVYLRSRTNGSSLACGPLADKRSGFFFSEKESSLFKIHFSCGEKKRILSSLDPWRKIERIDSGWIVADPVDLPDARGLTVHLNVNADPDHKGIFWSADFLPGSKKIRLIDSEIASLSLENFGPNTTAVYPGASGTIIKDPVQNANFSAVYPSLRATMNWMAVWNESRPCALYFANHDPRGARKTISMIGSPENGTLDLNFKEDLPFLPDQPLHKISLSGQIVWRSFDGDWFDAALIYRDWVRENASWFPKLDSEGRTDMPDWMKKLCLWGRLFGYAKEVVPEAVEFQKKVDIPVGIHWYVWHQIPFDNDYPHYFPPKEGFVEGVKTLHQTGKFHIIPYTNGRLWDTRDKKNQDYQFSSSGKAGVCINEAGAPCLESYRSKEIDGSRVVFGVMCPASKVWKEKMTENIQKLVCQCGLDGVYMDQIAAGTPCLCCNPNHGHPLYGGSWWTEGYRDILKNARKIIPKDKIFASECNAEFCVNLIHGMVCWHIDGKDVPAWSTVYSGLVFPYGRSYDSNSRAMKMKWAQNLVFGDQPGWFPVSFLNDPVKLNYLRPLVRFRFHSIPYFYKGEAARPISLLDPVPTWTEDWNIFGKSSLCTMPVVQTGVRRILDYDYDPNGNRIWSSGRVRSILLIFTNYSDEDVQSRIKVLWKEWGINPQSVKVDHIDSEGKRSPLSVDYLNKKISFPKNQTWGIELRAL
ncbi:MAG: DUF6259 domain-containing protein [Planctomycetia bacterium]|nr:DUF6259 domain-containing protein [Planctomycetia bacterium]